MSLNAVPPGPWRFSAVPATATDLTATDLTATDLTASPLHAPPLRATPSGNGQPVLGSSCVAQSGAPPDLVVDLGYGRLRVGGAGEDAAAGALAIDVRTLLAAVDEPAVLLDGVVLPLRAAWRQVFAKLGLPLPVTSGQGGLVIGYPSTWGAVRRRVLEDIGADSGVEVTTLARAVLVARSHADPSTTRCALVETSHVAAAPIDPVRPMADRWDVTLLQRGPSDWTVQGSDSIAADSADVSSDIARVIDDGVEAVFVDGDAPAEVTRAVQEVTANAVAGRVVAVDSDLVLLAGWRTGDSRPRWPASTDEDEAAARSGVRARVVKGIAAVTAAAAIAGWLALSVSGSLHPTNEVPAAEATQPFEAVATAPVELGRTTLEVPTQWRQSAKPQAVAESSDGSTSRTVFADVGDGRRIIVVQTEVREGSTRGSVASSLRNRIDQRGDDVVREFSPETRYAGRAVISYRETPVSGSAISWYVLVESGLQVSIGCQPGTGAQPVEDACHAAVGSVRIAPAS